MPRKPKPPAGAPHTDAPLNERQLRFCAEYVVDFCGKDAAIRAGYSKRSAASWCEPWLK